MRVIAVLVLLLIAPRIAEEIFPSAASKQFRLRIDAPDGTRVAVTEQLVKRVLATIRETAGEKNLDLSLGYVGVQGSSYPINDVFLFTNGPQQAIINVGLQRDSCAQARRSRRTAAQEAARSNFPDAHFSFDPGDLVNQTLNFGSSSLCGSHRHRPAICRRQRAMPKRSGRRLAGLSELARSRVRRAAALSHRRHSRESRAWPGSWEQPPMQWAPRLSPPPHPAASSRRVTGATRDPA